MGSKPVTSGIQLRRSTGLEQREMSEGEAAREVEPRLTAEASWLGPQDQQRRGRVSVEFLFPVQQACVRGSDP
jgi:hypothetical protein